MPRSFKARRDADHPNNMREIPPKHFRSVPCRAIPGPRHHRHRMSTAMLGVSPCVGTRERPGAGPQSANICVYMDVWKVPRPRDMRAHSMPAGIQWPGGPGAPPGACTRASHLSMLPTAWEPSEAASARLASKPATKKWPFYGARRLRERTFLEKKGRERQDGSREQTGNDAPVTAWRKRAAVMPRHR